MFQNKNANLQGETRQRHQRQHKKDATRKTAVATHPFCYDRIEANPLPPKGNATQSSHAVRPFTNRQDFTTQQSCFKIKTQTCRAKLGNATNGNTKRTQQGKSLSQHTPFATTELRQTFPQPRIRVTTTRRTSTVAKPVPTAQNRGKP